MHCKIEQDMAGFGEIWQDLTRFCGIRARFWAYWVKPSRGQDVQSSNNLVTFWVKPSRGPNTKSYNKIAAFGMAWARPDPERIAKSLVRGEGFGQDGFQFHASLKTPSWGWGKTHISQKASAAMVDFAFGGFGPCSRVYTLPFHVF